MTTEEKLFQDAVEYSAWIQSRNNREHALHEKAQEEQYNREITEMRVEELEKELQEAQAEIKTLKEHHQRDEELLVQRTNEIKFHKDELKALRQFSGTAAEPRMAAQIAILKAWIRISGERDDTCTYDILREICSTCRCDRRKTSTGQ